jgi:glycosyltransferase involved in cell wall biosynthesis
VIEALALGVPVVGYAEALEGLTLSAGEGILVAEDAEEMVRHLRGILLDPDRARALGEQGRIAVAGRYGVEHTYGLFPALYRDFLAGGGKSDRTRG